MDAPVAHSRIMTNTEPSSQGLREIRRLVLFNFGLVVIQTLSAGFLMSGYGAARTIHASVGSVLGLGALAQAVASIAIQRRGRVPARLAGSGIALFVLVVLQIVAGHTRWFWLHVPVGVALVGGLMQQTRRLDTYTRGTRPTPSSAETTQSV